MLLGLCKGHRDGVINHLSVIGVTCSAPFSYTGR